MMYGGDPQHQRPPGPPLPPGPPPPHHLQRPHPPVYHQQQHHMQQQQQGGNFPRGPPGPPPMMRQSSASSTTLNAPPPQPPPADFNHQHSSNAQGPGGHPYASFDPHSDNFVMKRMRKIGQRRAVDYTSTVVRYMQIRMWQRGSRDRTVLQATPAAAIDMLPPVAYSENPSTSFASKFVHTSLNKNRCSINRVVWTPSGRRLITGSQSGEFTLWNGQSFNFEMIIQAHDQAVRSMVWSYNDNWMVTGDDGGSIKYWQTNMNNVKVNKSAHKESVRDLSFCRTDLKFCSCSDDNTVKVWDFARCQEECSLQGHGWDVKSVDWHPMKSLLVSGGKDSLVKLWDAKSGKELCSFHGHKNIVLSVKWNQNGNWLLTASKDQSIKLYDIRAMKELESFRGHRKDVTALAWHPFHEEYFVSGSFDGSIFHWLVEHETPQAEIPNAHDSSVWDLAWHPNGYLLCSGGNDNTTKFWCRNRPGDTARERSNAGFSEQNTAPGGHAFGNYPGPEASTTPGPFAAGLTRNDGTIPGIGLAMPLSIDPSVQGDQKPPVAVSMPPGAPPLPPGPHPSLLVANQQQAYQSNLQQVQQHQSIPQQMSSLPMPPPNMPPMQSSVHQPLLPHPHLPHPRAQLQPLNMPSNIPSSMPGSLSVSSITMAGPMGLPGNHQMVPPMPQGHFMGMNLMPSGSGSGGGIPSADVPNGLRNMQPPTNAGGTQLFSPAGGFNRPQNGQMPLMPGLSLYQSGNPNAAATGFGHPSGMQPPLPPGPPPHGQTH